jgi:ectoine hydroxylase-related dioxygenase (phytanoyl-CoA dioxygenase family)
MQYDWANRSMDYRVSISESERTEGRLRSETTAGIVERFDRYGYVVLDGLFPVDLVDGLCRAYLAQYGSMDSAAMATAANIGGANRLLEVGRRRYEIAVRMTHEFRDPRVYAGDLLFPLVSQLLNGTCHLSGFTIVVSHPGSEMQDIHRDYSYLFLDDVLATLLPTYAVNVSVPLVDVDRRTGPTGAWLGSRRWPRGRRAEPADVVCPETKKGDCVLMDYRTLHAGMPNTADVIRPILYMAYARPWFFDEGNHRRRIPLDMPIDPDEAMPEDRRELLTRAFAENHRRELVLLEASEVGRKNGQRG